MRKQKIEKLSKDLPPAPPPPPPPLPMPTKRNHSNNDLYETGSLYSRNSMEFELDHQVNRSNISPRNSIASELDYEVNRSNISSRNSIASELDHQLNRINISRRNSLVHELDHQVNKTKPTSIMSENKVFNVKKKTAKKSQLVKLARPLQPTGINNYTDKRNPSML